jgi:ATP-dependent RNA helicase RhlB
LPDHWLTKRCRLTRQEMTMTIKTAQHRTKDSAPSPTSTFIVEGPIFGLNIVKDGKPLSFDGSRAKKTVPGKTRPERAREMPPLPAAAEIEAAEEEQVTEERAVPDDSWDISQFDVPPVEGRIRFHDFDIPASIMHGLADLSFNYCTPIQSAVIEHTLSGGDATGRAQTGTGKTAAFLVTVLTRLLRYPKKTKKTASPRALIIAPTRELVLQIADDCDTLSRHTGLNIVPVYGGMDYQKQLASLAGKQVDIVVATPGRLLDFQRQQAIHLGQVEIFVIDEADRMLDMGFIPDVRHIIYSLPPKTKRQTLLFSATLTPEVTSLSSQWTKDPVIVEIEPEQVTVETVEEIVYLVTAEEKFALLYNIITRQNLDRVIIFGNRRDETRKLADMLRQCNIKCDLLSGDVEQKIRMQTLDNFKAGKFRALVATDVAGRGIHVEDVSHVINYTLPYDPEDYVHRIGRTGRAGKSGTSISFASEEDSFYIPDIEEYIGHKLHCKYPEEEWLKLPETIDAQKLKTSRPRNRSRSFRPKSRGRNSGKK